MSIASKMLGKKWKFLSRALYKVVRKFSSVFRFPDAKTGGLFDFYFLKGKPDRRF